MPPRPNRTEYRARSMSSDEHALDVSRPQRMAALSVVGAGVAAVVAAAMLCGLNSLTVAGVRLDVLALGCASVLAVSAQGCLRAQRTGPWAFRLVSALAVLVVALASAVGLRYLADAVSLL
jgi:hypothetical protein